VVVKLNKNKGKKGGSLKGIKAATNDDIEMLKHYFQIGAD